MHGSPLSCWGGHHDLGPPRRMLGWGAGGDPVSGPTCHLLWAGSELGGWGGGLRLCPGPAQLGGPGGRGRRARRGTGWWSPPAPRPGRQGRRTVSPGRHRGRRRTRRRARPAPHPAPAPASTPGGGMCQCWSGGHTQGQGAPGTGGRGVRGCWGDARHCSRDGGTRDPTPVMGTDWRNLLQAWGAVR